MSTDTAVMDPPQTPPEAPAKGKRRNPNPPKKYLIRVSGLESWSSRGKIFKEGDTVTFNKEIALDAAEHHNVGKARVTVLGLTRTEMQNPRPIPEAETFEFEEGSEGWDENEYTAPDSE